MELVWGYGGKGEFAGIKRGDCGMNAVDGAGCGLGMGLKRSCVGHNGLLTIGMGHKGFEAGNC